MLGIHYSWAEEWAGDAWLSIKPVHSALSRSSSLTMAYYGFLLALLKTLPFQERWLCTSSVFAARAASGSADAVTEPAPAVPFPFPEISWHCCSLVDQDPVSNSLQCTVNPLIPPYKQFQWFMWINWSCLLLPFSSLPCSAPQCLVFWPKAMGSLSSFPPSFWVPAQSAALVLAVSQQCQCWLCCLFIPLDIVKIKLQCHF